MGDITKNRAVHDSVGGLLQVAPMRTCGACQARAVHESNIGLPCAESGGTYGAWET